MSTQNLIAIILGLFFSGTWLIYKLNRFQWLQKINDPKGIVAPSFIFLSSPFLIMWIVTSLDGGGVDEIIKPILPLATFILGQVIARQEKREDTKQQKMALATMIIYNVETNVIRLLSRIEGQLMASLQNSEDESIANEIKILFEKFELEVEKLCEKLSFQLDVIKISGGINVLSYVEKVKKDIKRIELIKLTPENKSYALADIRLHIVEGYANIMALIKESVPENESAHIRFLDSCALRLNQERERLMRLRKTRELIMNHWRNKPINELMRNSVVYFYFQFDLDPEGEAVREIEALLERFEMQIKTVNLDANISGFEITPTP